jgi:hypothetical protein
MFLWFGGFPFVFIYLFFRHFCFECHNILTEYEEQEYYYIDFVYTHVYT